MSDGGSGRRGLRDIDWADRYSTSADQPLEEFYGPALHMAERYDRATGFFRSSFFALTRTEIGEFALRGGKIRLLCSPDLEREDIDAIREGASARETSDHALRRELHHVLGHPHSASGAEILAALYAGAHLEIRLAIPAGKGIFHDKFGIFTDLRGDSVSFVGSVNETWRAWHPYGNHETFEVFTSWGREPQRPRDHSESFARLWAGDAPGVAAIEPSEDALGVLVDQFERDPVEVLREMNPTPPLPSRKSLMPHQRRALKGWRDAGRRGILKHATGSGKTITAVEAIRLQVEAESPSLIVVPSTLLLEQWDDEIRAELSDLDPAVLLAGGGHSNWRKLLGAFTRGGGGIVIATVATASGGEFLDRIRGGDHLLLVADEVHRLGARGASKILGIESGHRLGLSATPERAGDPAGTALIFGYFGSIIKPEFSLADAVAAGRLCPYEYHVRTVHMTAAESEEWEVISNEIKLRMARLDDDGQFAGIADADPYLRNLLIRRARIAKGAQEKAPAAAQTISRVYREGQKWLVYCDDTTQLETVRRELGKGGLASMPYFAEMEADRPATLELFERDGGILVAIKCLDEGVDIPSVSHALIAASSRNPREFIQRRGRVLRVAPEKRKAVIYDLMVEPPLDSNDEPFRSLVLGELARAAEFARNSSNPSGTLMINKLAIKYGIDPDTLAAGGYEEEQERD